MLLVTAEPRASALHPQRHHHIHNYGPLHVQNSRFAGSTAAVHTKAQHTAAAHSCAAEDVAAVCTAADGTVAGHGAADSTAEVSTADGFAAAHTRAAVGRSYSPHALLLQPPLLQLIGPLAVHTAAAAGLRSRRHMSHRVQQQAPPLVLGLWCC